MDISNDTSSKDKNNEEADVLHEMLQISLKSWETLEDMIEKRALDRLAVAKKTVYVKTPEGETLCVKTNPALGISGIKSSIREVLNVRSDQMKLFFDGKLVESNDDDDDTGFCALLSAEDAEFNICDEAVLDLVYTNPEIIIYARKSNGKIFTLKATYSTTVESVKAMIEVQGCIPVDQQRLVFGNKILQVDSAMLSSHRIQSHSTLHILKPSETFVFVKTQTGKVITCNVTSSSTVAELKQVIFNQEHIPVEQQCISFYNRTLEDDKTLEQYYIQPGSSLCVTEPGAIQVILNFCGNIVPLVVMPESTISELKMKIQELDKEYPIEKQQLYFGGSLVEEDHYTLTHYGIRNMSTLDVSKSDRMDVLFVIKFADGSVMTTNHYCFNVSFDVVKSIKRKIFLRKRIPINQQELFFGSQKLDDQKSLSHYGIKNGSVCTLQLFKLGKSRVFVSKQEEHIVSQEITLTDSVRNFKNQILAEESKDDSDHEQWKLVFAGQQLDDDHKMRDYHIQSGSVLNLLKLEDKLIYLQMPSEVVRRVLRISSTVGEVKNTLLRLGKESCTSPNQQQLMFAGKQLEDDVILADCGIEYGSVVHPVYGLQSKMKISVELPDPTTKRTITSVEIDVTPSTTIAEIKAKIQSLECSTSSDRQLYYGQCQLENSWSLQEYNIQESAILQLLNPVNDVCLFIHTSMKEKISFFVSRNTSGSKLKKKIFKRLGLRSVDQELFLSGNVMLESESTLSGTRPVAALYVLQAEEMLIDIQTSFSKSFTLVVSRFIAVCDLKLRIQQHEKCVHISPSKQRLTFDQKVLDDECSLSECNVTPGSTILLLSNDISLYIKVLSDSQETTVSLAVQPSNTIAEIKRRIAILLNIPMHQQRLLFKMKNLKDGYTLKRCKIVEDSSLVLAPYSTSGSEMDVFIRVHSGEVTKLAIKPNITIIELKHQILKEKAILPSQQKLFCGSQALHDEDHLLDYDVQVNSILDVVTPGNMLIFVKTLQGDSYTLTVTPTSTVLAIKMMIHTKVGTPLDGQQITFLNQVLHDYHTLLQCNVGQLSTLFLLSPTELHIYVELLNGSIMTQSLSSGFTVKELKNLINTNAEMPTELLFHGQILQDAHTLAQHNVQNESILYEVRGSQAKLQLFLNSPHVKTVMLEVYPLTTILEAKTMLHELESLPVDEQEFFLHDKQLENHLTFMDYDVQNKSTLNVQLVKPGDIMFTVQTSKSSPSPQSTKMNDMQIAVSTFQLTMPQSATVEETMVKIHDMETIPLERMSLYIADNKWKWLDSRKTLADYNLQKVTALEVVGKCRRGVPIFIKTLTGDTVRVVVMPITTVRELREKIKQLHGISVGPLHLIYANKQLEDNKMMKDYKLLNEATVHMLEPEEMLINVQYTSEKEYPLIVKSSETVSELKSRLCTLTSIQPELQLLSLSKMGTELKNEHSLLQCGVKGGTLLYLAKGIAKDGMKVKIHSSEGEKYLTVKEDQLVIELKSAIRGLTYTPEHQQRIIFASQLLEDRQSLKHYSLSPRCQLHILKPEELLIFVMLADDDSEENMISLIVLPSITVKEVKKEFLSRHHSTLNSYYVARMTMNFKELQRLLCKRIVYDGTTLEDDMTLTQCNVQNGSLLFLVQLSQVEICLVTSNEFEIGFRFPQKVNISDQIQKLKSMIAERTGVSPNEQKLVYAGHQLEDNRNLADYNIQDDSELYVLKSNEVFLFVTTPDSETFNLITKLESSIEEVKDEIEEMLGISSDIQELIHAGIKLKDHKKLSHYCKQTCSRIYVVQAEKRRMCIIVESSTEKQFSIRVMDSLTILELRECIQDQEGIPLDQHIKFTCDRQELEDHHTLSEYNIQEGSTVHLELATVPELVTNNSQSVQEECEVTQSIGIGEQEFLALGSKDTTSKESQPTNSVDKELGYSSNKKCSSQSSMAASLEEECTEEADSLSSKLQCRDDDGTQLCGKQDSNTDSKLNEASTKFKNRKAKTPVYAASEPRDPLPLLSLFTVQEAFRMTISLASEWQNIGILLEPSIDEGTLATIRANNPQNVNDCLREMLIKWSKQAEPHPSWAALANAIEPFDPKKAKEIRKKCV